MIQQQLCRTDAPAYHYPDRPPLPEPNLDDKVVKFYNNVQAQTDTHQAEEIMNNIFLHSEDLYHGVMQLMLKYVVTNRQPGQDANFYRIVNDAIKEYIET